MNALKINLIIDNYIINKKLLISFTIKNKNMCNNENKNVVKMIQMRINIIKSNMINALKLN